MVRVKPWLLVWLLFASPLRAGDSGTIKGSITVAGKKFIPDHAYALVRPHPFGFTFDKEAKAAHLVFSVEPYGDDSLQSYPPRASGTQFQVLIGADPEDKARLITISFYFHVEAPEGQPCSGGECYESGGPYEPVFVKRSFDLGANGRIAGTFTMKETLTTIDGMEIPVAADLEFDVPVFRETKGH